MRVLFTADWHLKLGQKNVPQAWQKKRFNMLVEELNRKYIEEDCDLHIIGGDIFDSYDPSSDEIELYFELVSQITHPSRIYAGNHEMKSKTRSVLHNLAEETARCNPLVRVVTEPFRSVDFDIIDYVELHKKKWQPQVSDICFTHVRGAIEPHVVPELDLALFNDYSLVITGDLHSFKNTQKNEKGIPFVYPGSPLTTSFHRNRTTGTNGFLVVDTNIKVYVWHELGHLPQLIRKTITVNDEMVADEYDRVIYEVEGDITELAGLKDSELLDKKVNKNVSKDAALDLSNSTGICDELNSYFRKVLGLKGKQIKPLLSRLKKVVPDAD